MKIFFQSWEELLKGRLCDLPFLCPQMSDMLQYFSWDNYWVLILALTTIYYVIILLLYYRKDAKQFFQSGFFIHNVSRRIESKVINGVASRNSESAGEQIEEPEVNDLGFDFPKTGLTDEALTSCSFSDEVTQTDRSRLFAFVHELMDEIGSVLKTASRKHYIKEELLTALQLKISRYPMLEDTAYKSAINGFVVTESRKACAVFLSDDELERLWKKGK